MSLVNTAFSAITKVTSWVPLVTSVRNSRYFAERVAKGPVLVRHGYVDKAAHEGLLPRVEMDESGKQVVPQFKVKDAWAEDRALFGQNDYIDILGSGKVHPIQLMYNVPPWLRGFRGNEFQMLVKKRKLFGKWMQEHRPAKWMEMEKRVRYLYKKLNHKTESRKLYSREHLTPTGPTLKDYLHGRAKPRFLSDL